MIFICSNYYCDGGFSLWNGIFLLGMNLKIFSVDQIGLF